MSQQGDRDQLVALLARALPESSAYQVADLAGKLASAAKTLQRIAELECSSEAADRDRVPCPGAKRADLCCCDYGYTTDGQHEDVPRVTAQGKRIEAKIRKLLLPLGLKPEYQGDPRGPVLTVCPVGVARADIESGRERGICVG